MAVPNAYSVAYRYFNRTGVVDTATMVTDIRTELTSLASPWVETGVGTGKFTSPTRADGTSLQVEFIKIDATNLQVKMWDQWGTQLNAADTADRILITAGGAGTSVDIYCSEFYIYINTDFLTNMWYGAVLDPYPLVWGVNCIPSFVAMRGPANNVGANIAIPAGAAFAAAPGAGYTQPTGGTIFLSAYLFGATATAFDCLTMSGQYFAQPLDATDNTTDTIINGRLWNAVLLPSSIGGSVDVTVPLDTGTSGTFRTSSRLELPQSNIRMAFRKA